MKMIMTTTAASTKISNQRKIYAKKEQLNVTACKACSLKMCKNRKLQGGPRRTTGGAKKYFVKMEITRNVFWVQKLPEVCGVFLHIPYEQLLLHTYNKNTIYLHEIL